MNPIAACAVLLVLNLTPARAAERPPPSTSPTHIRTDEEIRAEIVKGVIVNPDVFAADLHVTVAEGAVTLTGSVRNDMARTTAEEVALAVPGVRSVKNLLKLRSGAR